MNTQYHIALTVQKQGKYICHLGLCKHTFVPLRTLSQERTYIAQKLLTETQKFYVKL